MSFPACQFCRYIVTSWRDGIAYKKDLPSRANKMLKVTTPGNNGVHLFSAMEYP